MNIKWKMTLLALLGFSVTACCGTKKATKSEDKKAQDIVSEEEDPRIMLMYGVPTPEGEIARPIEEGVPFPDGSVVKPITEEEAKKRVEEIRAEKEAAKAAEAAEAAEK